MNNSETNLTNKNQIIYIPSYVEQGIRLLKEAKDILEDIETVINRGIGKIYRSGYEREIPYIEKGQVVSSAIEQMQDIIITIIRELKKYSNGKKILPDDAIIVADLATAAKYRLAKEDIDFTLEDYINKPKVNPKWSSNYLRASAGYNVYYGKDGRYTRETWCDLNPNYLVTLMKKEGIDLDYWIREDGVYMYGDYVMVAADIPHLDGTEQEAEYRKGDIVETSLGTGMVVDLCGMAEKVRKGEFAGTRFSDVEVWYDIYTAWHDGGKYQHVGHCNDPNCNNYYHKIATNQLIKARETLGERATLLASVPTPVTNENTSKTSNTTTPSNKKSFLSSVLDPIFNKNTSLTSMASSSVTPKKEVNSIQILNSLGLTAAAGVGAKIYTSNTKKDEKNTEEDKLMNDSKSDDLDSTYNNFSDPEFTAEDNEKIED